MSSFYNKIVRLLLLGLFLALTPAMAWMDVEQEVRDAVNQAFGKDVDGTITFDAHDDTKIRMKMDNGRLIRVTIGGEDVAITQLEPYLDDIVKVGEDIRDMEKRLHKEHGRLQEETERLIAEEKALNAHMEHMSKRIETEIAAGIEARMHELERMALTLEKRLHAEGVQQERTEKIVEAKLRALEAREAARVARTEARAGERAEELSSEERRALLEERRMALKERLESSREIREEAVHNARRQMELAREEMRRAREEVRGELEIERRQLDAERAHLDAERDIMDQFKEQLIADGVLTFGEDYEVVLNAKKGYMKVNGKKLSQDQYTQYKDFLEGLRGEAVTGKLSISGSNHD